MNLYGLRRGFITPNPIVDVGAFVGPRSNWAERLTLHLRGIIQSGRVPKAVVWGPFGVGKTHLLHFLSDKLKDLARIVYVETPPCHRRTKFSDFHGAIMRKLGREEVLNLLEGALKSPPSDPYSGLGVSRDMATFLKQGLASNRSALWRYLSGERLTARERREIDAVSSQIGEDEAVEVLGLIARLIRMKEKRQLILFIDEFENTLALLGDSLNLFREAVRGMVDPGNEVGAIFVTSARDIQMVGILAEDTVRRRIGYSNFIQFPEYSKEELEMVIRDLLRYWRDPAFDVEGAVRSVSKLTKEEVIPEFYPLTADAVKKVIELPFYLRESGRIDSIRPKEVLETIDQALMIGQREKMPVIDSNVVDEASYIFQSFVGGPEG